MFRHYSVINLIGYEPMVEIPGYSPGVWWAVDGDITVGRGGKEFSTPCHFILAWRWVFLDGQVSLVEFNCQGRFLVVGAEC